MATRFNEPQPLPLDVLLASIPSLPRPILARLTARMIDHLDELDELDGDPDAEQTGDEGEPDFSPPPPGYGPGCSIGDPDHGPEELGEDDRIGPDERPIADPQAYREQLGRIRADRCWSRRTRWGRREFHLYQEPTVPTKRNILRRKRGMSRSPRA